jgi:hypothetical protein
MRCLNLSERKPNATQFDPGEGMQTLKQALAPLIHNLVENLQFPMPPQPLPIIPRCLVLLSASTIILVIPSGSSTGYREPMSTSNYTPHQSP